MRLLTVRTLRMAAVAFALVACDAGRIVSPLSTASNPLAPGGAARFGVGSPIPGVVISQVYGGGGNSGATLRNDFIELLNHGTTPVDVTGWSVQYASAAGSTWQVTALSGTIQPGAYYLVQETAGAGGTTALPTPDASGGIAMSGTAGKVALFSVATAGSGTCPSASLVDAVSFGAATDCGVKVTKTLSNTTAAIRGDGGCAYTNDLSVDFATGAPTPRNSSSPTHLCAAAPPAADVASVTLTPATASINSGATQQFTATAFDAGNAPVPGTAFTFTSSNAGVASVNGAGLATGLTGGTTTITAASANGKSATASLTVVVGVAGPDIRVSELHYDNSGTDQGEALEIEGPAGTSLAGWSLVLYNGSSAAATDTTPFRPAGLTYNTTLVSGVLAQGASRPACNARGVLVINYPTNGIQNGGSAATPGPDGIALLDNTGTVIEFLSYEGSFTATDGPAAGLTSTDIGVLEPGTGAANLSLRRSPDGSSWAAPAANDFGYVNACGGPPAPPPPALSFSGRDPVGDPPLPVGFEAQVFASESGVASPGITWSSETPAIATVDNNGVFHGLAVGTAILRATAADGTTATISYPITSGVQGAAPYAGNEEFGEPADADASDDYIIRHDEYALSYSSTRNTPNWVSYRIDATNFGSNVDRCNCFTMDPLLPATFTHLTTADYTGAGASAGYGIDRGHMARSADRTAGTLDNARTYYLSNVIPQAADLNQGPWAQMENFLGDQAKAGKEVYVIVGPAGSKGTVKNEGKIVIPAYAWKVAVIMDHGKGLTDVHAPSDMQVIAIVAPNEPGVKSVDWHSWQVTVDSVQALTKYDLLALLPDNIERAVESNDRAPTAAFTGATTGVEGATMSFSGATSSDPDAGDVLTFAWTFGDGTTATGESATHTYADNGSYTLTLVVTDSHGVTDETSGTITVSNVAPTATFIAPPTVTEGTPFSISLANAIDPSVPDLAHLTYAFDCGTGAGFGAAGASSSASCTSIDNGTLTVRARISDGMDLTEYSATVTVTNAAPIITSFVTPAVPTATGTQITATVTFGDAGTGDSHVATIAWGDGQSSTVNATAGVTTASATHAFASAGFYTVTVTVTDNDDASATRQAPVLVVYDASAGSVKSSGWIGEGGDHTKLKLDAAYAGGSTPSGSFELRDKGDGLLFTGASFEYLVLKGALATVRGTGSAGNGTAIGYMISALDGKLSGDRTDRVRVKVWNRATGAVLFDSEPGVSELAAPATALGGGNVTIKR